MMFYKIPGSSSEDIDIPISEILAITEIGENAA